MVTRYGPRRVDGGRAFQHGGAHDFFDYHVVCLAGDGCMQEGVAMEAVAFAGQQKLIISF
jgi:transketolase